MAFFDSTNSHLYSVYFAPRGAARMFAMGAMISQLHLSPFDHIIGIIGESGAGKSMLIKGMFPGLELTNDDAGVNVRPLPLLNQEEENVFYVPHTYHVDVRFELGFTQPGVLADVIMQAKRRDRRVVIEHYDMLHRYIPDIPDMLIGLGEEILVTRPTLFGPKPEEVHKVVARSIKFRQMAHSAEDLCEKYLSEEIYNRATHGDIRKGFVIKFPGAEKPDIDLDAMEAAVLEDIASDIPISYVDQKHISFGGDIQFCTGPRTHVKSTGMIENFRLIKPLIYDPQRNEWLLVGRVGPDEGGKLSAVNSMDIQNVF